MFVSPPFRHNDVPVPGLFECLTPAPISSEARNAMVCPVNTYASRDEEAWRAPSVQLSHKERCSTCIGVGGTLDGMHYKKAMDSAWPLGKEEGKLRVVYSVPERSQVCEDCGGSGWVPINKHVCKGHRGCRNRAAITLEAAAPACLPVNRQERTVAVQEGMARLHISVVQARNLPARDLWKVGVIIGVSSLSENN